jgi:hypothetical protein
MLLIGYGGARNLPDGARYIGEVAGTGLQEAIEALEKFAEDFFE